MVAGLGVPIFRVITVLLFAWNFTVVLRKYKFISVRRRGHG